jgi:ferritin-like metal-binding protein YciE
MPIETLEDLFLHGVKDLYDAEKQLVKALPKMAKAATSEELQAAFEEHLEQTKTHVSRLEEVFKALKKTARGQHCPGMEGLIKEGQELIEKEEPGPALDAALIGAAQKVEHYEIASYGTLVAHATIMEQSDLAALLEETLNEEKETDEKLTELASTINWDAEEEEAESV